MKRLLILAAIAAASCHQAPPQTQSAEIRTIENVPPHPALTDPPPMLTDDAASPKFKDAVAAQNMIPLTEQDDQVRARLPFAPAIAMDPVDGSKISIRASTPMIEVKNRIYYFSSEENKRAFVANPDQFTKGLFSKL
jgi:YHS domain-containing protein